VYKHRGLCSLQNSKDCIWKLEVYLHPFVMNIRENTAKLRAMFDFENNKMFIFSD
jgi:hypothetical protein